MRRAFVLLLAGLAIPLLSPAQPLKASDEMLYPVNPPRPALSTPAALAAPPPSATGTATLATGTAVLSSQPAAKQGAFTIDEVREEVQADGSRAISVKFGHATNSSLAMNDIRVVVYFYDQSANGSIDLVGETPRSRWLTPPVDWSDGGGEMLSLQASPPPAGRHFYGAVLGLYYQGKLETSWYSTPKLQTDFALPLSIQ